MATKPLALRSGTSGPLVSSGLGSALFEWLERKWIALNFGTSTISTNAAQTPAVATASTFIVDATALTANRSITPSIAGAGDRQAMSFVVFVPQSSGGFFYQLVADSTLNLNQTMWVDVVLSSGAWVITGWKPITQGF